jgi:hypothetical protein
MDSFTKSGITYTKKYDQNDILVYEREDEGSISFEVFIKKLTPICLDFQNRVYSTTEFKVKYPSNEDFGKTAWTAKTWEQVESRIQKIIDGRTQKGGTMDTRECPVLTSNQVSTSTS